MKRMSISDITEPEIIFAGILDEELYKKHRDFFDKYSFSDSWCEKLAEALREFHAVNDTWDIVKFARFFSEKYRVELDDVKLELALGMCNVKSLLAVELCIMAKQSSQGAHLGSG